MMVQVRFLIREDAAPIRLAPAFSGRREAEEELPRLTPTVSTPMNPHESATVASGPPRLAFNAGVGALGLAGLLALATAFEYNRGAEGAD